MSVAIAAIRITHGQPHMSESEIESAFDRLLSFNSYFLRVRSVDRLVPVNRLNWICSTKAALAKKMFELDRAGRKWSPEIEASLRDILDAQLRLLDVLYAAALREESENRSRL